MTRIGGNTEQKDLVLLSTQVPIMIQTALRDTLDRKADTSRNAEQDIMMKKTRGFIVFLDAVVHPGQTNKSMD